MLKISHNIRRFLSNKIFFIGKKYPYIVGCFYHYKNLLDGHSFLCSEKNSSTIYFFVMVKTSHNIRRFFE